jgi:hypothetical protein
MNHRDHNTDQPCLPPEAYCVLWAAAKTPAKPPTKFRRVMAAISRILPLAFLLATLPVETPREVAERTESLVHREPVKGPKPDTQPLPKWTL